MRIVGSVSRAACPRSVIAVHLRALAVLLERQAQGLECGPRLVRIGRREHQGAVGVLRDADDAR